MKKVTKVAYIFYTFCIEACTKELQEHTFTAGIPDYYFENGYLDGKLGEVKKAMNVSDGVTFGFLTDIHISKSCVSGKSSGRLL